jgi:ring-1,2-phenylacetyl-CoA epoxidase subunit PaaE
MPAPRFHRLVISDIRHETEDAVSLAFAVPARLARAYSFLSGQYLTLRAMVGGEDIRRSYSICSGLDDGEMRVVVKRVAGGAFSHFVQDRLKPGDEIEVMTPAGQFTLPPPDGSRTIVAVACGSGITPVMAHLKIVLAREPESRFVLLYGNRTGRDIIFAEALAGLKDRYLGRADPRAKPRDARPAGAARAPRPRAHSIAATRRASDRSRADLRPRRDDG